MPILKHDKWADVWETLTTDADLNYTDEKETVSLSSLVTSATSAIYQAITDGWTMCGSTGRLPFSSSPISDGIDQGST